MNKGTGCIRARIRDLVATTAGQHSFTMGLTTDLAKLQTGTITNAEIHYGLQSKHQQAALSLPLKKQTVLRWNLSYLRREGHTMPNPVQMMC